MIGEPGNRMAESGPEVWTQQGEPMKKKAMIRRLQCELVTTRLNLRTQTKRVDELAARVARLEQYTQDLESALEGQLLSNVARDDRIAELERRLAKRDAGSTVDWEAARRANTHTTTAPSWHCPFCHQEIAAGTAHVCENAGEWHAGDGSWTFEPMEGR